MAVAIVTINNLEYMPFVKKYSELLDHFNMPYDVIFWDRNGTSGSMNLPENYYFFSYVSSMDKRKISKISDFYYYRKYLTERLRYKKYDKVIILASLTGVMLFGYLIRNYPLKYVFDIRDYTYDKLPIYRNIMARLVDNSYFTAISSHGFREWLPKSDKYVMSHNCSIKETVQINPESCSDLSKIGQKIRISFIGLVRYFEENVRLIDQLKNDEQFELYFIGDGACGVELHEYCLQNNISNVCFSGRFQPHEKPHLYQGTDFINNLYGSESFEVKTAIANRLYDCAIYRKPIIVSQGTYMERIVELYNLGISLDLKKDSVKYLVRQYVESFNAEEFSNSCIEFLKQVNKDEDFFKEKLYNFLVS